ncbi:indolepyruvate oxidoreductase subunit beta [Salinispira pacifica]|uniref:Indolepyruvate oxidoreductase subunit IorA n=1 Tax=Salinispira pacifica TaxID=1307761 RepID=V5WEZ7_9SPIO|nr:indolepyruvate oxidoreductase subunit beta [Salinispira pacifica]AHC14377.1 Indolepyruvate oxidoreductase subunit IorA [Salinispira pacifica]
MKDLVLLGDEALALGAIHAGISQAYGYPGTPSTEILEYLLDRKDQWTYTASWCSNEKTAYESAVGASLMNRRCLVTMKHVGLNVAADPFMNSVLMNIKGGLVLAVADDPGMHSSQNEQDSRWFADFAGMPCLEPRNQQEAYEMTRAAFDLSEKFHVPVMVKLVTRLSHSRAVVTPAEARKENPAEKFTGITDYMVLPAVSRKHYADHLNLIPELESWSSSSPFNRLEHSDAAGDTAYITTGLGGNYYEENLPELDVPPARLQIGSYPIPVELIASLSAGRSRIICLEEGYPYVERLLCGLLPSELTISGKMDGTVPASGELNPDNVRPAMGLAEMKHAIPGKIQGAHGKRDPDSAPASSPVAAPSSTAIAAMELPMRPPQLCQACPHGDTFDAVNDALKDETSKLVTSDIGCYTLGFLPPHKTIETALCMGASIPMARGAAEAGMHPVVATIGDSTFMHSGLTGLADAASADIPMTIIIMDNETTAMTGGQNTIVRSQQIRNAVLGLGVDEEHLLDLTPLPKNREENARRLKEEFHHRGLSVVIAIRECIQTLKRRNRMEPEAPAEAQPVETSGASPGKVKYDIILAGVGGQGILSVAAVIATAAMNAGLQVRQSEVHGMAQRGGAVQAHLRISSSRIPSDLIGFGRADMILSMEPMEALRYTRYLSPLGKVVSAAEAFTNIPDYPNLEDIHGEVRNIAGGELINTVTAAMEAGSSRAANMVLVGAASRHIPLDEGFLLQGVRELFTAKGEKVVQTNIAAFKAGRQV